MLALYGERPRHGGKDKLPESSGGKGTCLLYPVCASERGHGNACGRRQIPVRERVRSEKPGKKVDPGIRNAGLGLATQSMVRGPAAWVAPRPTEP